MTRRLLFGVALFFAPGTILTQEAEPPVFPAGTEAVLLDMVVRDEEGRLVPDLRAGEVQVFEDGQRCEISSFRLVRVENAGRPASDLTGPSLNPPTDLGPPSGGPGGARQGIQPAAEGSRSASVEDESLRQETGGPERLGSVVLLVFDHLGRDAATRAREAALEMIARPFPDRTWFAVLKVGQVFSVLQPFTEDRARLADPIVRATIGGERAVPTATNPDYASATEEALALAFAADEAAKQGGGGAALAAALARLAAFTARYENQRRGHETLYPLVAVSRALRTVRGRKTMLYFSEGLPVPQELHEVFRSTISDANRSNLTVYGFDARGLYVDSPWKETQGFLGQAPGAGDARVGLNALTANVQLNLQTLADSTGGFLVANTNDLRPGLERVAADLRAYYEVAYVTPKPVPDGTWREIEVKVTRPRAKVRARKGYFALPPGAPLVRPSELPLIAALEQETLPRDVPLRAAAVHLAGAGEERDVLVALKVPLSAATFESRVDEEGDGEEWQARLSLLARVRGPDGHLVARMSHDTPLEGTASEAEAMRARSLVVKRALRLSPGRYTLEAAVLDRYSSEAGASRVAFEVPAETGLSLGSLTIVRPEPLPEGGDDLLRAGDVRGTPRLGDSIVAAEGEVVGVFLSLQRGESSEPPELTLEVRRGGQIVSRSEADLPEPGASGRVAYLGQIPARAFEPGRYVVHARARQGAEEASAATSFRVVAPEPDAPAPAPAGVVPADPSGAFPPPEVPADVAPILEVAGRYVAEFQEKFRNLVAEETYRQWAGPEIRTLLSDVVFVTLPGDVPWVTFRDVYEVNGQEVRDREARLEALFMDPDASTIERANAILGESARFNLGPASRTMNTPTFALVMLLPRHQGRFRWERRGTREFHGRTGVELRAVETGHPTLVHDTRGEQVLADAQFWVDAETGRVLRTNVRYVFPQPLSTRDVVADDRPMAWVDTRYRPEPGLALWVPDNMYERYENVVVENLWGRGLFDRVEARARYADYRRFEVETSEGGAHVAADVSAGAAPPRANPPEVPADVAPLLEAAGRYVVDFQDKFRDIVAEETYRQWTPDEVRTLQSDIVFVTLPGDLPWVTFRDVYEVNGQQVRDRDARLEALFMKPDGSTLGRAEAIRGESARFNLGASYRDINVPTLALVMLDPRHQGRFRWERKGTREFSGHTGVELGAVEVASPTLVRQLDGRDVTAEVRAWVEKGTGRVLRTEARYRIVGRKGRPSARSWVDTQYRPESALALWVPEEMYERYEHSHRGPVEARARYSNHRRFQVETSEERARLAGEGAPPSVE